MSKNIDIKSSYETLNISGVKSPDSFDCSKSSAEFNNEVLEKTVEHNINESMSKNEMHNNSNGSMLSDSSDQLNDSNLIYVNNADEDLGTSVPTSPKGRSESQNSYVSERSVSNSPENFHARRSSSRESQKSNLSLNNVSNSSEKIGGVSNNLNLKEDTHTNKAIQEEILLDKENAVYNSDKIPQLSSNSTENLKGN